MKTSLAKESRVITNTDVLVIGGGLAGLTGALMAARQGAKVLLLADQTPWSSSSYCAQGGIAAATDTNDSVALHFEDTCKAGRGLCSVTAVRSLVEEAPFWVQFLTEAGVNFSPELGLEGGHSRRRIHHVRGTETGFALVTALSRLVALEPNITMVSERVTSLLSLPEASGSWRCYGAYTQARRILASATLLATGGYSALYSRTTNPQGSKGEGLLLAYAAGAALADLEFEQFHPTALKDDGLLLSEALRGEGGLLLNGDGERFTDELSPRDEVTRAIAAQTEVFLDLRAVDLTKFKALVNLLKARGYDPTKSPVPVAPAAHYSMGGVRTDLSGQTSVAGLLAAGEVACTGIHGANRLASNSLLECLVFGARAGKLATGIRSKKFIHSLLPTPNVLEPTPPALCAALTSGAGVVRTSDGLGTLADAPHTLVRLIGEAALSRKESRGSHLRTDYPQLAATASAHLLLRKGQVAQSERWV